MVENYCVKRTTALVATPFFHGECANLTISQKQFPLFMKHITFFRRAIVDISICKGEFWKSFFLQRAAWKQLLLRGSIWSIIFLNRICFFKTPLFYLNRGIAIYSYSYSQPFFEKQIVFDSRYVLRTVTFLEHLL